MKWTCTHLLNEYSLAGQALSLFVSFGPERRAVEPGVNVGMPQSTMSKKQMKRDQKAEKKQKSDDAARLSKGAAVMQGPQVEKAVSRLQSDGVLLAEIGSGGSMSLQLATSASRMHPDLGMISPCDHFRLLLSDWRHQTYWRHARLGCLLTYTNSFRTSFSRKQRILFSSCARNAPNKERRTMKYLSAGFVLVWLFARRPLQSLGTVLEAL